MDMDTNFLFDILYVFIKTVEYLPQSLFFFFVKVKKKNIHIK